MAERKPKGYWKDKFKEEYSETASALVGAGYEEGDLADYFGVTRTAIQSWKNTFPEFDRACKGGKHKMIKRMVAKTMLEAAGYDYSTSKTRVIKDKFGNVEKVEETTFKNHQPANNNLLIFLLCNLSHQLGLADEEAWQSKQKLEIDSRELKVQITGEVAKDQIIKLAGKLLESANETDKKQIDCKVVDGRDGV